MAGGGQTVKVASQPSAGKQETLVEKLVTKEDPLFVHKFLGVSVLLSFILRLSLFASGDVEMGFVKYPQWTIPTLALHLFLNVSSFEFKIPPKRIASGYRIWPEYRLHSLVFAARCLVHLATYWYEITARPGEPRLYLVDYATVIASMLFADLSSMSVGKYQSGFARELEVPAWVKFFFSASQLFATSYMLIGTQHHALLFFAVLVIQGNAFLMTLRRKNIASHNGLIATYGISLGLGILIALSKMDVSTMLVFLLAGSTATMLRVGPRVPILKYIQNNKYILWTLEALLINRIRPVDGAWPVEGMETKHVGAAASVGMVSMLAIAVYKCQKAEKQKQESLKQA